jgi:hypothetical protein
MPTGWNGHTQLLIVAPSSTKIDRTRFYVWLRIWNMRSDLFISHASEDKTVFVRALADALQNAGLRVWYDEFSLFAGSSLRESIDRGMAESYIGIVVLSHHFFAKNWPRNELNGLFGLSMSENKALVPIWLDVTAADVSKYSPMLADRVALRADQGLPAIVAAIRQQLVPAKLLRLNRNVTLYRVGLDYVGTGPGYASEYRELISPIPAEWFSKHGYGIPGVAVFGVLARPIEEGGEFVPDNFRENLIFVEFLHDLIAREFFNDPRMHEEAERQREGHIYLIDRRVPDPQGRAPFIDIIGSVSVQAGKAVAGSYRRNPDHELLTAEGFFLLPTTMEGTLDLELRSKCLETESRKPQVRLNDTEGEERRKLTAILTDQEKPIITSQRSEPAPAGQTAAKRKGWRGWLDRPFR